MSLENKKPKINSINPQEELIENMFSQSTKKDFVPTLNQIQSLFPEALIDQKTERRPIKKDSLDSPYVFNIQISGEPNRFISLDFSEKNCVKIELMEPYYISVRKREVKSLNGFNEFMKEWRTYLKDGVERCNNLKNWGRESFL